MSFAGEGFTSDEEIALPDDIGNAYVRGRAKNPEAYWAGADKPRRRK